MCVCCLPFVVCPLSRAAHTQPMPVSTVCYALGCNKWNDNVTLQCDLYATTIQIVMNIR